MKYFKLFRSPMSRPVQQNAMLSPDHDSITRKFWKSIMFSGLAIYIFYISFSIDPYSSIVLITKTENKNAHSSTNISHLVFGIAGSSTTWRNKRWYIEAWWRPNITRGYVFLERFPEDLLPWPHSSPPFRISENTAFRYKDYDKHPGRNAIRMARVIVETLGIENRSDQIRWYVMGDDDTVFFINNLVKVLGEYDHRKYYYIGMNSECYAQNILHAFGMAYGGGRYALSYPLAQAIVKNLDVCIKRYPTVYGSDHIIQSCVADLGVSLTQQKGFHQIDLRNDISGLLSAHPQSPLISLHHFDAFDPIFPSMNCTESVKHLFKSAKADESRLLQQTICYHKQNNWSFSISWGYSIHIYESIYPPSILRKPLQTFTPWSKWAWPSYMFNTRLPSNNNPCEAPHVFFFDAVEIKENHILTSYSRRRTHNLSAACSSSGNHSADHINRVHVLSPLEKVGDKRECCNIMHVPMLNSANIKLHTCLQDEMLPST